MKTAAALLACPLACMAAAVGPRAATVPEGSWTAGVWKPAYGTNLTFWGVGISASGGNFFLNKDTSAYCPSDVSGLDCSGYPGGKTVFVGGNNTVSLDVSVPGGQQVYIAADGALSYTVSHSAALPEGAITTGFSRAYSEAFGAPIVLGNSGHNWYICPTGWNGDLQVFQIYLSSQAKDNCYGVSMRTYAPAQRVAYEYA